MKEFSCGIPKNQIPLPFSDVTSTCSQICNWLHEKKNIFFSLLHDFSPNEELNSFSTDFEAPNAIFTKNADEIISLNVVEPPSDATTYVNYLRSNEIVIHHQLIEVQLIWRKKGCQKMIYISCLANFLGWGSVHSWTWRKLPSLGRWSEQLCLGFGHSEFANVWIFKSWKKSKWLWCLREGHFFTNEVPIF